MVKILVIVQGRHCVMFTASCYEYCCWCIGQPGSGGNSNKSSAHTLQASAFLSNQATGTAPNHTTPNKRWKLHFYFSSLLWHGHNIYSSWEVVKLIQQFQAPAKQTKERSRERHQGHRFESHRHTHTDKSFLLPECTQPLSLSGRISLIMDALFFHTTSDNLVIY